FPSSRCSSPPQTWISLPPRNRCPARRPGLLAESEALELRRLIRDSSRRERVAVVAQLLLTEWESCIGCCCHSCSRSRYRSHSHHSRSHHNRSRDIHIRSSC